MAAKRAHHPMHIKRRTRGSSNEISFSVLDAAREARDAEERDRREGGSGRPFSFHIGEGEEASANTGQRAVHRLVWRSSRIPVSLFFRC